MMLSLQRQLHDAIVEAVRREFSIDQVPPFSVEVPPNRALGDLAITVAFQLARVLKKPPRAIAQQLASVVVAIPSVARVEAAPNGYLNVFLDRPAFLKARLRGDITPAVLVDATGKTIVEHTAINPNKAAHIGHLRNAVLR